MRGARQQHIGDDIGQLAALLFIKAALGDPGRADADTGGVIGDRIAGDGVAVGDDARQVEDAHRPVAGEGRAIRGLDGAAVNVEQVRVGPAVGNAQPALLEPFRDGQGVPERLLLEFLELPGARQFEGQGQRGKDLDVRPPLFTGKDGLIHLFCQLLVGGQDDGAARTVQGLVRRRGDDVCVADGGGNDAGRHQPADVGDVGQQVSIHRIRDLAEFLPVGDPRIG